MDRSCIFQSFVRSKMIIVLIFIFLISGVHSIYENNDISRDIITKGKEMYELILKRRENERYGKCWYNAVTEFEQTCGKLTEDLQVKLAIGFANCFLAMTDQTQIDCDRDEKQNLRRICFQELKDRAFLTFTEFYTHTQNMCYFLRNQLWHKETEDTIDMLTEISREVAAKLTVAEEHQEELLIQQKIALELQKQIFEHGNHLSASLFESRENLVSLTNEFRSATIENNEIVMELFGKIQSIQNWMLGEYTIFNAIIFYTSYLLVTIILTSSPRTLPSRLPMLLVLTINMLCEYTVRAYIIGHYDMDMVEAKILLDFWIWSTRKFFIAVSILVCFVSAAKFSDLNEKNNMILKQLIKQNAIMSNELNDVRDILKKIGNMERNVSRMLPHRPNSRGVMVCVTPIMDSCDEEMENIDKLVPLNSSGYNLRNRSRSILAN